MLYKNEKGSKLFINYVNRVYYLYFFIILCDKSYYLLLFQEMASNFSLIDIICSFYLS